VSGLLWGLNCRVCGRLLFTINPYHHMALHRDLERIESVESDKELAELADGMPTPWTAPPEPEVTP
jgi:hypothetical protein